jgi:D-alanyl-D-alanine carboxypeptidase
MHRSASQIRIRLLASVLGACLVAGCASATAEPSADACLTDEIEKTPDISADCAFVKVAPSGDACLQEALAKTPEFSGVALLRKDGTERVAAQGVADASSAAMQTNTRFNLGSANKMFTAVAVMQLVEQGKLELDAPIGRWVEGLAPPVAAVTLRQLLTHSGGLGSYLTPENISALQEAKTIADLMKLVDDTSPQFEPGSRFDYSNTGFLLLGAAVEKASGQAFNDYLDQHIFKPAGMTMTSMDPKLPTQAATGFTRMPDFQPGAGPGPGPGPMPGPGGPMPPPPPSDGPLRPAVESMLPGSPAGSAYSTAGDLARFFDALQAGKLVTVTTAAEMTRGQIDATPPGGKQPTKYGLGFFESVWEGHRGYGHGGGAPGVNVETRTYPDDDALFIVLTNRDPQVAAEQLISLRSAAFGGKLCN